MALTFDVSPDEIDAFLEDTNEQLALLDQAIVKLEARSDDEALLQGIFRAAHTLKGNAGLIQHHRMAELTHALETVLDRLRKGQLAVTPELVDVLLASVDGLKALKEELFTREESAIDVEVAVHRLHAYEGDQAVPSAGRPADAPSALITPEVAERLADPGSKPAYRVTASVDPGSIAPAARIYQLHAALCELAEVLATAPPPDEIEMGSTATRYEAVALSARGAEELQEALAAIPEVTDVQVAGRAAPSPDQPPEGAPAPAAEAAPAAGSPPVELETRVRIGIDQLDRLMNLTGELVVSRTHLLQIESDMSARRGDQSGVDLNQVSVQLSRIIDQLHEEVMRARMVPVSSLFVKFPRLVRDVSRRLNKKVEFIIEGQETELDRSVIEAIGDPIIHLLRNAIDHGLEPPEKRRRAGKPETGTVRLAARQQEGHIRITVSDDGQGIDPDRMRRSAVEKGQLSPEAAEALGDAEAIELIFGPGMSTKQEVTDLSGRGVGMDIVRTNIEQLNGSVEIRTQIGVGTTFELTLPLTLAIIPAMLVTTGGNVYAVPLSSVVEVHQLTKRQIQTVHGCEVVRLRDQVLPLLRLRRLFDVEAANGSNGHRGAVGQLVVIRWGRTEAGLVVDELIGNQEVVIKSLGPLLTGIRGLAGGSILGSGRIALILDVPNLIKLATRR
jgi:two-component system, chemotaxis family, sensor kinase CheA